MTTRTITTTATERCEEIPDLATVEVTAISEGDSVTVTRTTACNRTTMIRESMTAVSANQIQTDDLQVENIDEMFDPATDVVFQATERLHIDCVPEIGEQVIVKVTDTGGTIRTVQFSLQEEVYRQLQSEALTAAMEQTREKAEPIAATEGVELAGIQDVTTKELCAGMGRIVDGSLASGSDTELCPKPITVSESVEAAYELTED